MLLPDTKRILLKLSGEVLMGDGQFGIDPAYVARLAEEVKAAKETGLEICLVIGGGNIFRGMAAASRGLDRTTGDYMGMLATVMNALAMHIAAAFPQALDAASLDPEVLDRERAIAREKAAESGKPENVQAKMVEGAVNKFAKENALLSQAFVMDNKTPVSEVVAQAGKDAGTEIVLKDYVRVQLGEGIEKRETDFAAEVAAAVGG